MAAVVNHLHFKEPVDPELFPQAARDLLPQMRAIDGFRALYVVQTGEKDVILLILGDSVDVLDRLATDVGSPWMREHVVPLLAGPPERHIGPFLAASDE